MGEERSSDASGRCASKAYTVNGLNQYPAVAGTGYSYDANGNLTGDGVNAYVYDGRTGSPIDGLLPEKEQRMQHFPPDRDTERRIQRRPRDAQPACEAVQHREEDEPEGTADWLRHIEAGRIELK